MNLSERRITHNLRVLLFAHIPISKDYLILGVFFICGFFLSILNIIR